MTDIVESVLTVSNLSDEGWSGEMAELIVYINQKKGPQGGLTLSRGEADLLLLHLKRVHEGMRDAEDRNYGHILSEMARERIVDEAVKAGTVKRLGANLELNPKKS